MVPGADAGKGDRKSKKNQKRKDRKKKKKGKEETVVSAEEAQDLEAAKSEIQNAPELPPSDALDMVATVAMPALNFAVTAAAQARDAVAPGQSQNAMEATQMLPAMSQLREQVAAAAEGAADAEPTLESAPVVEPIVSGRHRALPIIGFFYRSGLFWSPHLPCLSWNIKAI